MKPTPSVLAGSVRRLLGVTILVLAAVPMYRVLADPDTGRAGWVTGELVSVFTSFSWAGALLVLAAAVAAARFLPPAWADRMLAKLVGAVNKPRTVVFALGAALVCASLTVAFSWAVLDGKPNMIDAMAQALHARFLAEGHLAGPADDWNAFWHIQNTIITAKGWVSQYPPGHVLLLAAGMLLGVPWLIGPLLAGACVFFTSLVAERTLADRQTARMAAILCALSPFIIFVGASYLNHVPTAALLAAAVYCVLRARSDGVRWALVAGLLAGLAVTMRPLTSVAIVSGAALAAWFEPELGWRVAVRRTARLGFAGVLGALVPIALLLWYNAYFFGSPLTFGYNVALGPRMGVGFGIDPWGNAYGAREALGYTSSDLVTLGVTLLETPLSAVVLVGLYFVAVRRLSVGERVLAAWALVPVLANALYWHHGIYMGPRMLYEAAPAWVALFAAACVWFVRAAPTRIVRLPAISPRAALIGGFAFTLVFGLGFLAPQRAASYGGEWLAVSRIEAPRTERPALVFVHDAWMARLAMRLAAQGMRLDSVETAIRQNSTCSVQRLADAWEAGGDRAAAHALRDMDLDPRATDLPPIVRISIGNTMRVRNGEELTPECVRQVNADRNGILDIAPLVWQGDLPGASPSGPLYVRDLGPEANARLIAALPEREAWLLYTPADTADPVLRPYTSAIGDLWSAAKPQFGPRVGQK